MMAWVTLFSVVTAKSRIIREQKRAIEAEQRLRKAQESFMDNAHHELRTPLQILASHLQLLQDMDPRPEQEQILGLAQTTATHLGRLVQGLLDLSSLAHGTLPTRMTLSDLGPHLARLARTAESWAGAKGLDFRSDLPALPRPLYCDATRLCQSLESLLDNAVGFTDRGTISFTMTTRPEGANWHLRFEIEDQGPGLPPDWERLLHPFEQEEKGFRRQRGGLGIGLPLAAGIIDLLGGHMGLERLPLGTRAWVEILLEEGAL
ncbi:MAG: HAMP domain-containing histidine kinase [Acidobacteria bacterium]|nr:HAMP domain-containing histidine kinase [Acidobacteriota bacterium]MBI3489372.1 HAMP domain-containing histidine kinase [Acidobacteriota bacterium]